MKFSRVKTSALCYFLMVLLGGLVAADAQALSTWRTIADGRDNNSVWMASATTGWAVGDTGAIARTTDGGATWTEQVSGVTNHLYSVWGLDTSNVWAVGQGGAIIFWNGLTWGRQVSPVTTDLLSVRGVGGSAVWAVGVSGALLHWDGTTWATQKNPAGTNNTTFTGVWAADATNIWAVGAGGKIIKNDGTNWSSQTSGTNQQLNAVWGTGASNIYAVGVASTGGGAAGTFLHWNGTAWSAMTNNVPATGSYTSISGSDATHIWAVGTAGGNGVIRFYNGGAGNWTAQAPGTTEALKGVSAVSATQVVAVGARKVYDVYNGSSWAPQLSPTPPTQFNGSWGADDNKIWFVGQGGIIYRWNGTGSWTSSASPTSNNLNSVWGSDENNVWAVGAGGTIVKWNGTTWAAQTSNTSATLNAIYGTSSSNVWAVGASGVIVKWNGTTWATQNSSVSVTLTGVWASDANNAWAVGNIGAAGTGTILKCTANVWKAQSTTAAFNLNRVWGASATAIWAVGDGGTILKSGGTTWAVQGAGVTSVRLASIHGVNATNQWAVGGGSILRGNGTTWAADGNTPLAVPLTGVFATGVSSVFLFASNGMVFLNSPVAVPEIVVEQPASTVLSSIVAGVNFGTVAAPLSASKTFTLRNTGTADLTGLSVSIDGLDAASFQAQAPLASTLTPGASTTLSATFAPTKEGLSSAVLHVKSNDLDHASFNVTLVGNGLLPPKITVKPLSKTVNPTTTVTSAVSFTVAATGTATLAYQWRKGGIDIVGETGTTFTIPSVVESHEGTYDVKITNPATALSGIPTISDPFTLTVNDPVVVMTPPVAQSVTAGSTVNLSVVVASGSGPITYQWRKNSVNIAGATSATYTISNVQVAQGGNYSVAIKNPVGTVISPTPDAALNVADTTLKVIKVASGATTTLPALFGGSINGYTWTKTVGAQPSIGDPRFNGWTSKTLSITKSQVSPIDDSGTYTCVGSFASGNLSAQFQVIVYTAPPTIDLASAVGGRLMLPDGIVGGTYVGYTVPLINGGSSQAATSITISGLPTGLKVDPSTGVISGRPAVALTADKIYRLVVTASNAKGRTAASTVGADLLIKAPPYGSVGTFVGLIARDPLLNKNLGGRFDLTTTAAGGFTAKVTLGITPYTVIGTLSTDIAGVIKPHGSFVIRRTAPLPPLTVSFDIDNTTTNHVLANGDITDGNVHVSFSGWRKKWGTTMPDPAELTDLKTYLGYYTFGMDIPASQDGVEAIPQGTSYGSFTVAANTGLLTAAGRLADNTAFSCASFAGPRGQVLVYQALYGYLGSICGSLTIGQGTEAFTPPYGNNTIIGTVSWMRPSVTTTSYVYKAGFGPMDLTAFGGRYVAPTPAATAVVMGLTDDGSNSNARLVFTQGGVAGTIADPYVPTNPGISLRIKPLGGVLRPFVNPDATTLIVTPGTGVISGSFTLSDLNPATPLSLIKISRTAPYYGIIVVDGGVLSGEGYFMLARRPAPPAPPAPLQTTKTTPILSGRVVLEKLPVAP